MKFIDTDGEMTFENREKLNFIMHFMKKGAVEQVATKDGGDFIREDAQLSFNEIWLPSALAKQAEIEDKDKQIAAAKAIIKRHERYIPQSTIEALEKALQGDQ